MGTFYCAIPNTRQSTIGACADQCRKNSVCAYFSYNVVSGSGDNCALYGAAAGCPDDSNYPDYNSYKMKGAVTQTLDQKLDKLTDTVETLDQKLDKLTDKVDALAR